MNKSAIYHVTDVPYAYGKDINTLVVILRTAKNDINVCNLYYKDRYDWENKFNCIEMKINCTTKYFDFYKAEISVNRNRYRYYFEVIDKKGDKYYIDDRGIRNYVVEIPEAIAYQYPYIAESDLYIEQKWLQESVVYQIFVDRFYNGDKSNDPDNVLSWGDEVNQMSVFGGDLEGIIQKLDYLKDLGVNLLYLTPIFKSATNHKYNTCNYYLIDSQFGDIEVTKRLVDECHKRNIKIVFDAVFNHSGDDFFAFQDVIEKGEDSKYKDWYIIDSYPVDTEKVNYYTFANNVSNMPKFNLANEEVRNYLLNVGEYWVKEIGIDGWRLDVCDEVDHDFWRRFKHRIKKVNKDAIIIGEIMHEASSFLRGDQLDGIMNYPFKGAMIDFFARRSINCELFDEILSQNRMIYMDSITKQMWNLIGSHDTQRFLTECDDKIERMLLAIAFQFTYIGVPYIYYGDEVGLNGGEEPQSRKCMIWDKKNQNLKLYNLYKKMIKIRNDNKALVYGGYKTLLCKDNIIVFERTYENQNIIIAFNNNYHDCDISLDIKGTYEDLYNNNILELSNKLTLERMNFIILKEI